MGIYDVCREDVLHFAKLDGVTTRELAFNDSIKWKAVSSLHTDGSKAFHHRPIITEVHESESRIYVRTKLHVLLSLAELKSIFSIPATPQRPWFVSGETWEKMEVLRESPLQATVYVMHISRWLPFIQIEGTLVEDQSETADGEFWIVQRFFPDPTRKFLKFRIHAHKNTLQCTYMKRFSDDPLAPTPASASASVPGSGTLISRIYVIDKSGGFNSILPHMTRQVYVHFIANYLVKCNARLSYFANTYSANEIIDMIKNGHGENADSSAHMELGGGRSRSLTDIADGAQAQLEAASLEWFAVDNPQVRKALLHDECFIPATRIISAFIQESSAQRPPAPVPAPAPASASATSPTLVPIDMNELLLMGEMACLSSSNPRSTSIASTHLAQSSSLPIALPSDPCDDLTPEPTSPTPSCPRFDNFIPSHSLATGSPSLAFLKVVMAKRNKLVSIRPPFKSVQPINANANDNTSYVCIPGTPSEDMDSTLHDGDGSSVCFSPVMPSDIST